MVDEDNYFDFPDESKESKKEEKPVSTESVKNEPTKNIEKRIRVKKEIKEPKESIIDTSVIEDRFKDMESKITELQKLPKINLESELQKLTLEQQKIQSQMQLLTSFQNLLKNVNNNTPTLNYYSSQTVSKAIKEELNIHLENIKLNSLDKIQKLPLWNQYPEGSKEQEEVRNDLILLTRCIRDGRILERFNDYQIKLNKKKIENP